MYFLNGFFVTFIFTLYRRIPDSLVGVLHGINTRNFPLMSCSFRFIHPVQRGIFSIPAFLLLLVIPFCLRFCILQILPAFFS
ncbi:hypothetical protein AA102_00035 [Escherichia coli]|nr:hypothetical protein AA102_00035 [Escherichia coli]